MGQLHQGFHFLGIQYDVAQTALSAKQSQHPLNQIKVSLHPRSIRRSIDKIRRKQEEIALLKRSSTYAEHAANVHRLRYRWAKWWAMQHRLLSDSRKHIYAWIQMTIRVSHTC